MINIWVYLLVIAPSVRFILGDSFNPNAKRALSTKFKKLLLCTLLICGLEFYQIYSEYFSEASRPRTPYRILEISKNAGRKEIAQAVRQKLRLYHPDFRGGSTEAVALFHEIKQGGDLLLDANKRILYDSFGDYLTMDTFKYYDNRDTSNLFSLFVCESIQAAGIQFLMSLLISMSMHSLGASQLKKHITMVASIYTADLLIRFSPVVRFDKDVDQILIASTRTPTWGNALAQFSQFSLLDQIPILRTFAPFELAKLSSACVPLILTLYNFLGDNWKEIFSDFEYRRFKRQQSQRSDWKDEEEFENIPSFHILTNKELMEVLTIISQVNLQLLETLRGLRQNEGVSGAQTKAAVAESRDITKTTLEQTLDVEFGLFGSKTSQRGKIRGKFVQFLRGGSDRSFVESWSRDNVLESEEALETSVKNFIVKTECWKEEMSLKAKQERKRRMIGPLILLLHMGFKYLID